MPWQPSRFSQNIDFVFQKVGKKKERNWKTSSFFSSHKVFKSNQGSLTFLFFFVKGQGEVQTIDKIKNCTIREKHAQFLLFRNCYPLSTATLNIHIRVYTQHLFLTLSQTSPCFYMSGYKSFENTVGKGEIACNSFWSSFHHFY